MVLSCLSKCLKSFHAPLSHPRNDSKTIIPQNLEHTDVHDFASDTSNFIHFLFIILSYTRFVLFLFLFFFLGGISRRACGGDAQTPRQFSQSVEP